MAKTPTSYDDIAEELIRDVKLSVNLRRRFLSYQSGVNLAWRRITTDDTQIHSILETKN